MNTVLSISNQWINITKINLSQLKQKLKSICVGYLFLLPFFMCVVYGVKLRSVLYRIFIPSTLLLYDILEFRSILKG